MSNINKCIGIFWKENHLKKDKLKTKFPYSKVLLVFKDTKVKAKSATNNMM